MKQFSINSKGFFALFFFLVVAVNSYCIAQYREAIPDFYSENNYSIKWIADYPSKDTIQQHRSFFKKMIDWVAGQKATPAIVRPISVLAARPDSFLVVDQGNRIIFDVEKNKGSLLKCFRNNKSNFSSLVGINKLPDNSIIFTDSRLNKVFTYSARNNQLLTFGDSTNLQQPTGITFNKVTNEVWVTETAAHRIAVFGLDGKLLRTIGSRGDSVTQFNFPTFLWSDENGDVYVNDAMNFRIQIFDKNGNYISSFGKAGDATGYFASSKGIATDSYHNIYVVDALFNTVQIFNRQGQFLYNFGQRGNAHEEFWMPSGIYIDANNFIYIADSYNARVQIFQLKTME